MDAIVKQKRRDLEAAAEEKNYVLAGRIQKEINRLEELRSGIQKAVQKIDYIQAGCLQQQLNTLMETHDDSTRRKKQPIKTWRDHRVELESLTSIEEIMAHLGRRSAARILGRFGRSTIALIRRRRELAASIKISSTYRMYNTRKCFKTAVWTLAVISQQI